MALTTQIPDRLEEGATAEQVYGPITRTDLVRYAGASGDFNPIHHDDDFAREAGVPGVFAMGLFQAGLLSRLVSTWLGLENVSYFDVRYTGQVWPGDTLTFTGVVDRVHEDDGVELADCSFTVSRGEGDQVMTGSAVARVSGGASPS